MLSISSLEAHCMSTSPRRLGKYELLEQLGEGGMAEVWKAFDPQLKRYVAIKFLHASLRSTPNFMSRFIREGQAIASLHHPNIVQVYDFLIASPDDVGPAAYMIMDYIEGQTLEHYIALTSRVQQFPTANDIVRLFASISLAIDYAHEHDVIHRDIKPANILLDRRNTRSNRMGEPILTDFGLVKMMREAGLTMTGMTMGTPLYISPEQIQGQPGDKKSDLYSLGVVIYETCTGIPPFQGERAYILMKQHVQDAPPPPSQINQHLPPSLDSVMARFLAKNPEARYPTASSMTAALAQAFGVQIPEQIRDAVYPLNTVPSVGITHSSSPI